MYIVVVGAGSIGTPLIEIATGAGHEVVVVESDEQKADAVAGNYDCLVINADATDKQTLEDAGADQADALITTTDEDATNIMVCLLATELAVPTVVSVVQNPEHMNVFRKIGVHTMENPQQLIAEYLYRSVARPAIVDYMQVGEQAEVFEIRVAEDAPIAGLTLNEAAQQEVLPTDTLVVAVDRDDGDEPITPRGDTRILPEDVVTVYSASGANPGLTDVFGHHEDG